MLFAKAMGKALYYQPNKEVTMATKGFKFSLYREIKQDDVSVDMPYSMDMVITGRKVVGQERGYLESRYYPVYESYAEFFKDLPNGDRILKFLEYGTYIGYYGSYKSPTRQITPENEMSEMIVWRMAMTVKYLASWAGCKTSLERVEETYSPYDVFSDTGSDEQGNFLYTSVCQKVTWVLTIEY